MPVQAHVNLVVLAAQFNACDVLEQHLRTVRVGTHHDVAELLRCLEAPGRLYGVGKLGAGRCGFATDLSRRHQHVLLGDRPGDIRDCQAELGQLVRPDPDAHRVFRDTAAENLRQANSADTRQFVHDVDGAVVGQELLVIGAFRGDQRDQQQGKGEFLLDRHTQALDLLGDTGLGLGDAVLGQHVGHIEVRTDLE